MALDVQAAELEYISTKISQKELAKKFNVSENHIAQLSMQYKWKEKKKRWKEDSQQLVKKSVQEAMSTDVAVMAKHHFSVWTKLMNLVEQSLDDYVTHLSNKDGSFKIAHLERIANILTKVQEGQKIAKGDDIEIKKLHLLTEKLELERQKINGIPEEDLPDDGFNDATDTSNPEFWENIDKRNLVVTE